MDYEHNIIPRKIKSEVESETIVVSVPNKPDITIRKIQTEYEEEIFEEASDTWNHYNYMSWDQVNNSGVSRANQSKLSFTESNGNAEFYWFFDINNYASWVNKWLQWWLSVNWSNEYQIVGRWNDTSAQITTVLLYNHSGNTFWIWTRMVIYWMD